MKYIFSHPSPMAGGVQSLVINLVNALNDLNIESVIIDKNDGFIRSTLLNSMVSHKFVDIDNLEILPTIVNSDDIYVTFGNFDIEISFFQKINVRVFYWQVHPDFLRKVFEIRSKFLSTLYQTNNFLTKYFSKKIYKKLIYNHAVAFMSESHLRFLLKYHLNADNCHLLPIPIKFSKNNIKYYSLSSHKINIAYIGRPQSWKIIPFKVFLNELITNASEYLGRITLHIISTNCQPYLEVLYNEFPDLTIDIVSHDDLHGDRLTNFLFSNIDVVFSMGTSLLEAAKVSIPAVFADACFSEYIPNVYKYRWLYQSHGYNLGNPIYNEHDLLPGLSLSDILREIELNKGIHGHKCYEYATKNHSLDVVIENFIQLTRKTKYYTTNLYCDIKFYYILKKFYKSFSRFKFN